MKNKTRQNTTTHKCLKPYSKTNMVRVTVKSIYGSTNIFMQVSCVKNALSRMKEYGMPPAGDLGVSLHGTIVEVLTKEV